MKLRGLCLYLTGRSGSGKTTIARDLQNKLKKIDNRKITILDGDEIREHISKGLGFSKQDRSINVRRIGYIADIITQHNGLCICSNIAPYKNDRIYNKHLIESNGGKYLEIFVKAKLNTLIKRDPKGLYKINNSNIIKSFDEYEEPENPNIIIDTENKNLQESSNYIINYLKINSLLIN